MSGTVPPPAARPLGRAAGDLRPVFLGRGWCRRADPAAAPQRALWRAGVARCRRGVPGGGALRRYEGALGVRRSPSPGCPSVGRAARARRPRAVGAAVWAWVCRPSLGRAARRWCVWCVWCLCGLCELAGASRCGVSGGAVVRCAASLCLPPSCPPLLRYLLVLCAVACGCAPLPACVPRLAARHPPSSCFVGALFTLSSNLRWSALLRGVHFPLPRLGPCVWLGFFLCLLPRYPGAPPSLLLRPVRKRKDGGVGYCGGGGIDDDIGMCTSLAVVGVCVATAGLSPNVVCVCVWRCRGFSPYHLYGVGDL